jgi:hypothetical protein
MTKATPMRSDTTARRDEKPRPHDIALEYLQRRWQPVPVPYRQKRTVLDGWQKLDITEANIGEYFDQRRQNVGVQLGSRSDGLTDVDLDCPEALALLALATLLPDTAAIFGRRSKPRSHWLYITDLCESEQKAVIQFKEPPALALDPEKPAMLVELRIGAGDKGAQTLFPGSLHPDAEWIEWDSDGEPARVDGGDLKRKVGAIAAGALLARHYPKVGARHEAALVLGGMLARLQDWDADDVKHFVEFIARVAKDEEAEDRGRSAAGAVALLNRGEPTPGLPRMREVWGDVLTDTVAKWLGCDENEGGVSSGTGGRRDNQTNQLIALAGEAELFHSKEGVCYATVPADGRRETWLLPTKGGGGGFALWLRQKFYEETGGAPNSQSLTSALNTLAAIARYDGKVHEVYVRIAVVEQRIFLDLCDEDWHVLEIDASGWRLIADPPVRFLRRRGMLPLPMPTTHTPKTRSGAIDKLFNYVNVASESDFCLLVSYLLAALSGRGPFVVLVLLGEPGAAKSTLERMLKELIDPNKAPLRAPPRETRDLFVAANNGYLLAFDNFSEMPGWLSDMLCRLSTGGGFGTRQLYSDDDEMLFDAMRPVVLTCVDNVVIRGDLTDRAIFLTLASIPENKRRHQRDFWAEFERDKPAILGALLDIVALGLRELPHVKLDTFPRMADFYEFATACERGAKGALWEVGLFADAYAINRASAAHSVIEEDLVANAIRRLMQQHDAWEGGTAALLEDLNELVSETIRENKQWPKAANALSRRMNKVAGVLRKIGIEITPGTTKKTNRRLWKITRRNKKESPPD